MACSLVCALLLAAQLDPGALIPLYTQALQQKLQEFGPDDPRVARSAADLGLYLRNIGKPQDAGPHLARALDIDEKRFGPTHPLTAEDLENLASVSPPSEALRLHLWAAAATDPAISARNWTKAGALYEQSSNRAKATEAYGNALVREEKASGRNHQRVAVRLNDLAQTLDAKSAEPLFRRALAIQEQALGPNHPEVGVTANNLANALLAQKRLTEAEPAARRALRVLETALDSDQPRVATAASNLGTILRAKRDLPGARKLYTRALAIDEKAYGPNHPEVAADLENLADLLIELGERQQAEKLLARAAAITAAK